MTARMMVRVGSMVELLGGESMAAGGSHARRREEDRARDGDAAWGMRSGTRLGEPEAVGGPGSTLLMATGPRVRPGDILLPGTCPVHRYRYSGTCPVLPWKAQD